MQPSSREIYIFSSPAEKYEIVKSITEIWEFQWNKSRLFCNVTLVVMLTCTMPCMYSVGLIVDQLTLKYVSFILADFGAQLRYRPDLLFRKTVFKGDLMMTQGMFGIC